jgi:hypothetical protein
MALFSRLWALRFEMNQQIMARPRIVVDAAIAVLADGKPRTADEIYADGKKRGLFGPGIDGKRLYTALQAYIQRALGRGEKPACVQDIDRRFRINRPIDDWPAIDTTGLPPLATPTAPPHSAAATLSALQKAASGCDPDAFELAVCAAFELFGFASTHIGGHEAPDGHADALLGELRYRVMLECKLEPGNHIAASDGVAQAARYREAYRADYCAIIGLSPDIERIFISELRTHHVAGWTVDDIIRAVTLRLDCSQMRELFASGPASYGLDDIVWAQLHGQAKRFRVVASLLIELGLAQQRLAGTLEDPKSAPRLTADVALSTVDERLTAAGSTHGVTREEIDAAFTWLTSPYVGRAVWTGDDHAAIVIRPR